MTAIYTCGRCGRGVSKSTRVCPHCSARLAGIKCQSCGFVGSETDFPGDRCPKCRAVVYVSRPQPASTAPKTQKCKGCGRSIQPSDWTCPHCGYTQWDTIAFMMVVSLALIGAAILWRSNALILWGGGILGGLFLLVTVSEAFTGLKTPRR